jgi:U1 small nuclear ribonucleoprotein
MTYCLPPNLLVFFAPRDPIKYVAPLDHLPWDTKAKPYTGVSQYLSLFEDPKTTPLPTRGETKMERRARRRQERQEINRVKVEERLAKWDPSSDSNATGDAYKTLFVGRINYSTSEETLRKEFEQYGPIKQIVMIKSSSSNKPRGYAFVEFESERDMHCELNWEWKWDWYGQCADLLCLPSQMLFSSAAVSPNTCDPV